MRDIKILTGLRFFCALHIVIFHNYDLLNNVFSLQDFIYLNRFISYGEASVSFFFILSGFILVHVYKDKMSTAIERKNYLLGRVFKLYPLYLLAFTLDIGRVWNYFASSSELFIHAILKFFVSSFAYLFAIQSWIPRLTPVWNSPAWSISCEMFFYVMFLFLLRKIFLIKKNLLWLCVFYFIPLSLYFITTYFFNDLESMPSFLTFWRSFPILRLFEFMIGILLYKLMLEKRELREYIKRYSSLIFWGSAAGATLFTTLGLEIPEKVKLGILLAPFFSTMILGAYHDKFFCDLLFKNKIIQILGMSSYALYITHMPLKNFLLLGTTDLSKCLFYFVGVVTLSVVLYLFFEKPIQKKLKFLYFK